MISRSKPRTRPATTRTRAHRRARVARPWTLIRSTPDDWTEPCWTLARGNTLIYVGPCQGPAAHVHRTTADRALAQLNREAPPTANATARTRVQPARSSTPLHTPARKGSSRHR